MPLRPLLIASLLLTPVCASAEAGRFLMTVGDVTLARGGTQSPATDGAQVEAGDTIVVGPRSNAQVRMTDESIISLRPGTVLRIDEYRYGAQSAGEERSFFSLLKGGLRTVTGAIGRLHSRDRYAVKTPTATVGIRGTHYTLVHCDNDCAPAQVSLAAVSLAQADSGTPGLGGGPNGTFGAVTDGRIEVVNDAGQREFGANEFFHVASQNVLPQGLIAPPSFLYDRLEGQQRTRGNRGSETSETMSQSGLNAESRPSEVPPAPAPNPFIVTEQQAACRAPDGSVVSCPLPLADSQQVALTEPGFAPSVIPGLTALSSTSLGPTHTTECDDLSGNCNGPATATFDAQGLKRVDVGGGFIDRNLATVAEVHSVPGVIEWGRWSGGPLSAGGFYDGMVFGPGQGFHYVTGVPASPMPTSGTATFTLLGATTPTFSDGVGGGLGAGSVVSGTGTANFLNGTISATLNLAFTGGTYRLDMPGGTFSPGSPGIPFNNGSMSFTGGAVNVCPSSCSAAFVGFFAGPNASHLGLGYDVTANPGPFFLNGVAVMKRQ
jgi:hypothetical protein